jgi:ribosomal protein S18 acetylase RimI-like enzyme
MSIRPFRPTDAPALAQLSAECARGEADFVLNPMWETESELHAEFARFGIDAREHLLVADAGDDGQVQGMVGFVRRPGDRSAGMLCPIVRRDERGHGVGGELLRAAQRHGAERLDISVVTAGVGTRNRGGYSLLTSHGFRPMRQAYVMKCERPPAAPGSPAGGVELALATPDDAQAILALYLACGFERRSEEEMRAAFADDRHAHAVARAGPGIAAFVELETHWPQRPWVAFVGVASERRDRGLGSALVAWLLARHFASGARAALLALSPANREALRAYEKVGFRRFRLVDVLEKKL